MSVVPCAYLVLRSAGRWSDVFRLTAPSEAVLGRASANQIVIRSEQASRRHCRIYLPESVATNQWFIEDLGSRNGTYVNRVRITSPHPLHDGDKIEVAGFAIQFTYTIGSGFYDSDDGEESVQATDDQLTMELDSQSITDRRRHSDYLHANEKQIADSKQSGDMRLSIRSQLLKLAFELARLDDTNVAVNLVLDELVSRISLETVAIYLSIDNITSVKKNDPLSEMPLVATRQNGNRSYRRPPEPLLRSLAEEKGNALLARNILGDRQLATENSRGEIDAESLILAPIRDHRDHFLGMIHLTTTAGIRPFDSEDLQFVVAVAEILAESLSRLADQQRLARSLKQSRRKAELLQEQLGDKVRIIGNSEPIRAVIENIRLAAPTSATVLVRGESGVGKELVAAAIHHASHRKDGPLVCLNCAALSESLLESELFGHEKGSFTGATERKRGKFEMADGGTLMLDEIGEMNSELQAKLLRVLEGHPFERVGGHEPIKVDVRVVAATNRDLQSMVGEGKFRQDLYYRLHVVEIIVPPLRSRHQDCLLLARYFLDRFNREMGRRIEGFTDAAKKRLLKYHWPGNIRELRNVVERAVVLNQKNVIDESDLALSPTTSFGQPSQSAISSEVEMTLAELEGLHIERVLRHTEGNKSRASTILGIERSTLDRKLKKNS